MIQSITIEGFQALKKVGIELGRGINVISGPSDVGKSSVVRAIRSLPEPTEGHAGVRDGAKKSVVSLKTDNGEVVSRHKGKNVNKYTCGDIKFSRPGRSVPEPVAELLDMAPERFAEGCERSLHFSSQGEPAFLVADTPSDVARILGGVSGASVLTEAVREAARVSKNLSRDCKGAEAAVEAEKVNLEAFVGLDKALSKQEELEQWLESAEEMEGRLNAVGALFARAKASVPAMKEAKKSVETAKGVVKAFAGSAKLLVRANHLAAVEAADMEVAAAKTAVLASEESVASLKVAAKALAGSGKLLKRVQKWQTVGGVYSGCAALGIKADVAEKGVSDCQEFTKLLKGSSKFLVRARSLEAVEKQRAVCLGTMRKLQSAEGGVEEAKDGLEKAHSAWAAFVAEHPTCPLCGGVLKEGGDSCRIRG